MRIYKRNARIFTGCLFMTVLLFMGCGESHSLTFSTESSEETEQLTESGEEAEQSAEPSKEQTQESAENVQQSADTAKESTEEAKGQTQSAEGMIYIQVNGAVKYPGVYQLPEGARVFEAVELAGGMTDEAAREAVNQALMLTDGEMVTIYTQSEWSQLQMQQEQATAQDGEAAEPDDGRININTADADALCTIAGIGQSRAESIIAYRTEHGSFATIDEIKNVSGIKDGLFQKIKDKIKV